MDGGTGEMRPHALTAPCYLIPSCPVLSCLIPSYNPLLYSHPLFLIFSLPLPPIPSSSLTPFPPSHLPPLSTPHPSLPHPSLSHPSLSHHSPTQTPCLFHEHVRSRIRARARHSEHGRYALSVGYSSLNRANEHLHTH